MRFFQFLRHPRPGVLALLLGLSLSLAGCGEGYDAFKDTPFEPLPADSVAVRPVVVDSSAVRLQLIIPPPAEVKAGVPFPIAVEVMLRDAKTQQFVRVRRFGRLDTYVIPNDTTATMPIIGLVDGFAQLSAVTLRTPGRYNFLTCVTFTDRKPYGPTEPVCAQTQRVDVSR